MQIWDLKSDFSIHFLRRYPLLHKRLPSSLKCLFRMESRTVNEYLYISSLTEASTWRMSSFILVNETFSEWTADQANKHWRIQKRERLASSIRNKSYFLLLPMLRKTIDPKKTQNVSMKIANAIG